MFSYKIIQGFARTRWGLFSAKTQHNDNLPCQSSSDERRYVDDCMILGIFEFDQRKRCNESEVNRLILGQLLKHKSRAKPISLFLLYFEAVSFTKSGQSLSLNYTLYFRHIEYISDYSSLHTLAHKHKYKKNVPTFRGSTRPNTHVQCC